MNILHVIPFIVIIASAIIALRLPIGRDIAVPIFLLPWAALTPDIGVNLPISKILFSMLAVKYFISIKFDARKMPGFYLVILVMTTGLAAAAITLNVYETTSEFAGGDLRNGWLRVLIAAVSFLMSVIPVFLLLARGVEFSFSRLLKAYVVSAIILCVIGLVQYQVYQSTGQDILPIGLFSRVDSDHRTGLMALGEHVYMRPGSLAGEPKNLGMYAMMALILVVGFRNNVASSRWTIIFYASILFVVIILTLSTSALLSGMIWIGSFAALRIWGRPLGRPLVLTIYMVSTAIFMILYLSIVHNSPGIFVTGDPFSYDGSLFDVIYHRSLGRISVEDFDWIIIKAMLDDPISMLLGRGFGLAHLLTDSYIPGVLRYYTQNVIISPKSTMIYFFSSGGIFSLVIMVAFFARITPTKGASSRLEDKHISQSILQAQQVVIPLVLIIILRVYCFDIGLVLIAICSIGVRRWMLLADQRRERAVPSFWRKCPGVPEVRR